MIELFNSIFQAVVVIMVGIMGWFFTNLNKKADVTDIREIRQDVESLRENFFSLIKTLATKEDFNKLENKIDNLINRELDKRIKKRQ